MECTPPGSSVHGISQARILEWFAISFYRGPSLCRDRKMKKTWSCPYGGYNLRALKTVDNMIFWISHKNPSFRVGIAYLFICLHCVSVAAPELSLVLASGVSSHSFIVMRSLLIAVASLVAEHGLWTLRLQ